MSKNVLILAEHDDQSLKAASLSAFGLGYRISVECEGTFQILVLGNNVGDVASEASGLAPTLVADSPKLEQPIADVHAKVIAQVIEKNQFDTIIAASSTYSKDVLSRACGIVGGAMASDVIGCEVKDGDLILERPLYAGSVTAKCRLLSDPKFLTVRASAFEPAEGVEAGTSTVEVDEASLPDRVEYHGVETKASARPDLTEAKIVVSGGRAFKTTEDFEGHVGALADALEAAAGSSRALVDAGITPNELQVGQTGKVVAPELYIALGLSGAVQHLAGMKNSKVIVAINKDAEAPIFEVSDYGIVGDVYKLVPELLDKVKATQT